MAKQKDTKILPHELRLLRKRNPGYRGEYKLVASHVDSDPMSIMGETREPNDDTVGAEDLQQLGRDYRQNLSRVIAELAFAVNKPGIREALTALAEWMEAQGHTPPEIVVAFHTADDFSESRGVPTVASRRREAKF